MYFYLLFQYTITKNQWFWTGIVSYKLLRYIQGPRDVVCSKIPCDKAVLWVKFLEAIQAPNNAS